MNPVKYELKVLTLEHLSFFSFGQREREVRPCDDDRKREERTRWRWAGCC
jgi:hypothetical protein